MADYPIKKRKLILDNYIDHIENWYYSGLNAVQIKKRLKDELDVDVSVSTVRKFLEVRNIKKDVSEYNIKRLENWNENTLISKWILAGLTNKDVQLKLQEHGIYVDLPEIQHFRENHLDVVNIAIAEYINEPKDQELTTEINEMLSEKVGDLKTGLAFLDVLVNKGVEVLNLMDFDKMMKILDGEDVKNPAMRKIELYNTMVSFLRVSTDAAKAQQKLYMSSINAAIAKQEADLKVEEFEANRQDTMAEIAKLEEAIDAEFSVKE